MLLKSLLSYSIRELYCFLFSDDWTTVVKQTLIPINLQTTPLNLKTSAAAGSDKKIIVFFYNSLGEYAGGLKLFFSSTLQYQLDGCHDNAIRSDFSTTPPAETDKVWRITKIVTDTSDIAVQIYCNEVEVVSNVIAESTCANTNWNTVWSRKISQMKFGKWDSASDFYRIYSPGS